ncbi:MAG TPA: hypothetical protein DDW27_13095 [Bacteroidales bacterium]|nr:hypothetical protein [Bacteroidales bacterium]
MQNLIITCFLDSPVAIFKTFTNPLRIQLDKEVDDKVPDTVSMLSAGNSASGWEGRETGRH